MKLLCAVLLLAALSAHTAAASRCARPGKVVDARRCSARPPVDAVSLPDYTGTWYQIFANDNALPFTSLSCRTANYKARTDGNIDVLNCESARGATKAVCSRGVASRRPDGRSDSRLQVVFPNGAGPYNIAALLGDKEYGYNAAAVYACGVRDGKVLRSWFILARNPYRPKRILREILLRLKCKGYDVGRERFLVTKHGRSCKYFFADSGFEVGGR